jgi:hypothetical protein
MEKKTRVDVDAIFSTENLARETTEQTEQTPNNPVLRLPTITEQLLTSEVATISVKREADTFSS